MKTPSNNLEFKIISNANKSFFEITLFDKSKQKSESSISRIGLMSESFEIPYALIGVIRISKVEPEYGNFFVTMGINAIKGYGPLIYDKAIEIASANGCRIINHATYMKIIGYEDADKMSSPSATAVWNKYKDRKDVESKPIGDTEYFSLYKPKDGKYFYE